MSRTVSPPQPPEHPRSSPARRPWYRRRLFVGIAALAVVVAVAVGGGAWWYLRDDAPAAVDLDTATEAVAVATTVAGSSATVEGTWTVDTSIGAFSFEASTGTFVGFRVDEELASIGSTTAVGRTPDVSGTIAIEGSTLTAATIEADMTTIVTDDERRDDNVQDALETSEFPTATFVLTEAIELGDAVSTGAAVTVDAVGELTIHGVTTPVTLPLQAEVVGDTIVVVGSLAIELSTYGVEAPSAPIVVSVSDAATLELQLFLTRA